MTNKPYPWSTEQIAATAAYFNTPSSFFSNFPPVWAAVKSQVWKLEIRQVYIEEGNPSYELLIAGNKNAAIDLVPQERQVDKDLYADLRKRNVEFIRCRPVAFPLTEYLEWELACYDYNSEHGERIYFLTINEWVNRFRQYALHDFMIFDNDLAFIHNYDENGQITGGWMTTTKDHIEGLQTLFADIKSISIDYKTFLRNHS